MADKVYSILATACILICLGLWAYAGIQQEDCAKGIAAACEWVGAAK